MAKIVVITSRFPFPLEKGDKLRIYNQIKYLSINNELHLIAIHQKEPSSNELNELSPFCKSISCFVIPTYKRVLSLPLALLNNRPFQVQYFFSNKVNREIQKRVTTINPDAIYSHLIRTSEYVKHFSINKTLDYMDCFSKGFFLKINNTRNPILKALYKIEYKRLIDYEQKIFDFFNHHTIISNQDKQAINHPLKNQIEVVANGVDFTIFYPINSGKKYDLLFSGNMGYPPNIDAAFFAATEIMPLILKKLPRVKLLIAGINPPHKIKSLASDSVSVVEHFKHIRDAFAQSSINIVPVVTSIGLQNKILQAMAMKIPTITTPAGARGIDAENKSVLIIGETAEELSNAIVKLIENQEEQAQLASRAYSFVQENFSWEIHNQKLFKLILDDCN